ncbi:hypothetical protein SO802_025455 [Lithocarpus litseifolius]|uniref:Uncharacterized protein n=1 Tax=Lithocarpus litseifolius TaxID=425828 RepID=A0AAW2BWR3_9ROSI
MSLTSLAGLLMPMWFVLTQIGSPFTWSRHHPTQGRTYIRLDRALATVAWKPKFPGATIQHVSMSTSDHAMLAIHLPTQRPRRLHNRPPFHFEAMWLCDPRYAEVVQDAWLEGLHKPNRAKIINFLDNCKNRLQTWNKVEFGHVGKQIAQLEKKLQFLEKDPQLRENYIQATRRDINCWLNAENTMWHQRSRHLWITDGNRNTSFFHQKASNRKKRNLIEGMCDENGVWHTDDHTMEEIVLDYFSSIFQTNGPIDTSAIIDVG